MTTSRIDRLAGAAVERLLLEARCSDRPAPWQGAYDVLALPRIARRAARRFRGEVQGEPISVLRVGGMAHFGRRLEPLLDRADPPEPAGRRSLWNAAALAGDSADLVAAEIHPWVAARFRRAGWLIVPKTIRWRGRAARLPPERRSASLGSNLRRARDGGYTVEVANPERDDWREFLEEMAIPFARARFGDHAWIPTEGYLRGVRARCELLFLRRDGGRVAGAALVAKRDELWFALLGVRHGDPQLVAAGAITALYQGAIEHARVRGVEWIDAGRTSPFVRSGIARYKTKWGFEPVPDPLVPLLAVRVDPQSEIARKAFDREPVMILTERGLQRFAG